VSWEKLPAFNCVLVSHVRRRVLLPSTSQSIRLCSSSDFRSHQVIFGKLDKNQDGHIDLREWVSVLFDLFRFMR
jgi:hypothetical protein